MSKQKILHSEEVQEIMGQIPGWVIRWGVLIIFIIFMIILGVSFFIKYPETVSAPIVLTTINPPADLIAKTSGKIEKFTINDGDQVTEEQLIAVIFSTADYRSVLNLETKLTEYGDRWEKYHDILLTQNLTIGELQAYYSGFIKTYKSYKQYLEVSHISKKIHILKLQVEKSNIRHQNLQQQLELLKKDMFYEKNNLSRDSALYISKTISSYDWEKTKQAVLQKEMGLTSKESEITSTESSLLSLQEQLLELSIQYENDILNFHVQLTENRDQLQTQIKLWKEKYMLISPIKGKVTLTKYWSENQNISLGERLATIIPDDSMKVIGRMVIPSFGFAKIKKGQQVNIRLNGFPYMEYGILKGKVTNLSSIPDQEGYTVEVEFPQGMVSSYQTELSFIQQMDGTGDVITQDMRLIERFIRPIRSFFDTKI